MTMSYSQVTQKTLHSAVLFKEDSFFNPVGSYSKKYVVSSERCFAEFSVSCCGKGNFQHFLSLMCNSYEIHIDAKTINMTLYLPSSEEVLRQCLGRHVCWQLKSSLSKPCACKGMRGRRRR